MSIPGIFSVTFEGGTANQRDLVNETIALSLYDWNRLQFEVVFRWSSDPIPGYLNELAGTSYRLPVPFERDPCFRPNLAWITLRDDLDDPAAPAGGGPQVYRDVVHHELGHVLAAKLHYTQVITLCALYGGNTTQWGGPGSDRAWEDQISESFAETFKDVFLPRQYREWDNRTKWRLPARSYQGWIDVLSDICDCRSAN